MPLKNDDDRCMLDDKMIVLFAAAEWLARNKLPDAKAKLDIANRLKMKLQGRLVSDKRRNLIPLLPNMKSPNAVYIDPYRGVRALPPPIPR
jgi:hypothetical protein